jgi:hypothetical protein
MALVATTRTLSTTRSCVAFWNRLRARIVMAIASGEITPVWKTLSPSRTTSRSWCSIFRWCCCTSAIFSRTELDPISMAANVGKLEVSFSHDTTLSALACHLVDTSGVRPGP